MTNISKTAAAPKARKPAAPKPRKGAAQAPAAAGLDIDIDLGDEKPARDISAEKGEAQAPAMTEAFGPPIPADLGALPEAFGPAIPAGVAEANLSDEAFCGDWLAQMQAAPALAQTEALALAMIAEDEAARAPQAPAKAPEAPQAPKAPAEAPKAEEAPAEGEGEGEEEAPAAEAEEYETTLTLPANAEEAREIARILARRLGRPIRVAFGGEIAGFCIEPGTRAAPGTRPAPQAPANPRKNPAFEAQLAAAAAGQMPEIPDFSKPTHQSYRKKLAALVDLAGKGDIAALEAFPIQPVSTTRKMLDRYRNAAVIALKAQAAAKAPEMAEA